MDLIFAVSVGKHAHQWCINPARHNATEPHALVGVHHDHGMIKGEYSSFVGRVVNQRLHDVSEPRQRVAES